MMKELLDVNPTVFFPSIPHLVRVHPHRVPEFCLSLALHTSLAAQGVKEAGCGLLMWSRVLYSSPRGAAWSTT
jgi:hypothetical protein